MPTLSRFINEGVIGNLATLRPVLSPMLWNSIATGKRPDKHGIFGFIEPRGDGKGIQPVSSTSRKTKAIWNILTQSELTSSIVAWYASHPAEPIRGACVSEFFSRMEWTAEKKTHVAAHSVHPERLVEPLSQLRLHQEDIGPWHLAPFVPTLGEIPAEETPPVTGLQKILARCGTTHAAITYLLEHEPWDFAAVYYEAIDHVGHAFMQYHPPHMPHIDERLYERHKGVVTGIYRFHDMMLQRLMELAGDDTTVIICSDHGFLNDHLRPVETPEKPVGPEAWHRYHGMFAIRGPGIRRDERIYGATVLDITPTILTLFGLPVGADMDGKVLVNCFENPPLVHRVESWDAVEGEAGRHPADLQVDPYEQHAVLQQLVELGYIDAGRRASEGDEAGGHRGQVEPRGVADRRRAVTRAEAILRELHESQPKENRFMLALAECYLNMGQHTEGAKADRARNIAGPNAADGLDHGAVLFSAGDTNGALEHLQRAEQAEPRSRTFTSRLERSTAPTLADAERAFTPPSKSTGRGDGVLRHRARRHASAAPSRSRRKNLPRCRTDALLALCPFLHGRGAHEARLVRPGN